MKTWGWARSRRRSKGMTVLVRVGWPLMVSRGVKKVGVEWYCDQRTVCSKTSLQNKARNESCRFSQTEDGLWPKLQQPCVISLWRILFYCVYERFNSHWRGTLGSGRIFRSILWNDLSFLINSNGSSVRGWGGHWRNPDWGAV